MCVLPVVGRITQPTSLDVLHFNPLPSQTASLAAAAAGAGCAVDAATAARLSALSRMTVSMLGSTEAEQQLVGSRAAAGGRRAGSGRAGGEHEVTLPHDELMTRQLGADAPGDAARGVPRHGTTVVGTAMLGVAEDAVRCLSCRQDRAGRALERGRPGRMNLTPPTHTRVQRNKTQHNACVLLGPTQTPPRPAVRGRREQGHLPGRWRPAHAADGGRAAAGAAARAGCRRHVLAQPVELRTGAGVCFFGGGVLLRSSLADQGGTRVGGGGGGRGKGLYGGCAGAVGSRQQTQCHHRWVQVTHTHACSHSDVRTNQCMVIPPCGIAHAARACTSAAALA